MTAYPNPDYRDSSVYKVQLIEKITQLEDVVVMRQIAEQLGIDLDATDVEGIQRTPGVVGGRARVKNTRIPVWVLISYRDLGKDDDWFIENYERLTEESLKSVWRYYDMHKDEIDEDIRENDEA